MNVVQRYVMVLEDKLEVAIYGYNINNPSSVFTYIWNSVGVPIKEEDVRKIFGNVICETREHDEIERIVRDIRSQLSWGDVEEGDIDKDYIKTVLRQHGYSDSKYIDKLADYVSQVFQSRFANIIPEPKEYADDPSADDPENVFLGSRLAGVSRLPKKPLEDVEGAKQSPFKFAHKEKREKRVVPSLIKRRRRFLDPGKEQGDYTVHRIGDTTPSERQAAKLARAGEIARSMRKERFR
jgi:hypothetical protein